MPKISIVTVNLNNLSGLQKTIKSILNQTFTEFELIIVDGNSNDGSKEYINEISNHLTLWISEPDTGIYHAMNKGIKMAKGDYIYFLNSGDIFFDSSTLKNIENKINGEIGIYYGDVIWDWVKRKQLITYPKKLTYPFLIVNSLSHQTCFIKRSLFYEISFYNESLKIISDWEFIIYAICKKEITSEHLDMVVSIYDTSGISTNVKNREAIYKEKETVFNQYFPLFHFNIDGIELLNAKRGKQLLFIKKHKFAYRMLKGFMSLILCFLPKFDQEKQQ